MYEADVEIQEDKEGPPSQVTRQARTGESVE